MAELSEPQKAYRRRQARAAIEQRLRDSHRDWQPTRRIPDFALAADHVMDALGDLAAEILADGTMMRSLTIKNGVATLELAEATEILKIYVAAMRGVLDGYGAENYLEAEFTTPPSVSMDLRDGSHPQDAYTVTIQRRTRPTPHEFRQRAEARIAAALAECDAIETETHGQHDEDDDGKRDAVRRIRARLQEA
ncbi:hypothetical protein [Streptomyces sp. NPDC101145]|uniref:hypothetical protein n=1 Tax=Streptomyces sp. NPDC101145 TaxID=3366112 RepID=UPI0037F923E2